MEFVNGILVGIMIVILFTELHILFKEMMMY